jgi:hypothetical protein
MITPKKNKNKNKNKNIYRNQCFSPKNKIINPSSHEFIHMDNEIKDYYYNTIEPTFNLINLDRSPNNEDVIQFADNFGYVIMNAIDKYTNNKDKLLSENASNEITDFMENTIWKIESDYVGDETQDDEDTHNELDDVQLGIINYIETFTTGLRGNNDNVLRGNLFQQQFGTSNQWKDSGTLGKHRQNFIVYPPQGYNYRPIQTNDPKKYTILQNLWHGNPQPQYDSLNHILDIEETHNYLPYVSRPRSNNSVKDSRKRKWFNKFKKRYKC